MLEFESRINNNYAPIIRAKRQHEQELKKLKNNQVLMGSQVDGSSELEMSFGKKMVGSRKKYQENNQKDHVCQLFSQAILQIINDAVIAVDGAGKIIFLNSKAEKLTGWKSYKVQSLPLSHIFKVTRTSNFLSLESSVEPILQTNHMSDTCNDALLITFEQSLVKIAYSTFPIYDRDELIGTAVIFRETSSLHKISCQPVWQINRDSLTGLLSRSSFENYLEQALYDAKTLDQNHILCYLDLDRFKIINEVCGHLAGDEFLRQFSSILQKRIRKTDILARLGGDEFGLILQHCSLEQALTVLQTLHEEVRKFRFSWQNHTFNFTFSAGISLLDCDSGSGSSVLIEVDSACAIAKNKGRDRVQIYQADDHDMTAQRGDTKGVLRVIKALEEDQFLLYCQPIVPVANVDNSDCQYYYEILIRLQDEQGRLISPNEFLPAAERYGLMHLVDRWVIQNLFKTLNQRRIKTENIISEPDWGNSRKHCYAINLSGYSFNDDQFLEFVQEQFSLYSILPESICFEITETVAISNLNKAVAFIDQLRKIGCRFALDDFGSGMSSFGYLKSLPVDYIKIDGNFVKEITRNSIAYEIVKSINSIGHTMNIQTTAEFVENQEILTLLKVIGVDYAQGYGIAKPSPL
jgi:diguanylate cyclase (GGDEF)-like protein